MAHRGACSLSLRWTHEESPEASHMLLCSTSFSSGLWSVNVFFLSLKQLFQWTGCRCVCVCVWVAERDEVYSCSPPAADGCRDRRRCSASSCSPPLSLPASNWSRESVGSHHRTQRKRRKRWEERCWMKQVEFLCPSRTFSSPRAANRQLCCRFKTKFTFSWLSAAASPQF